MKIVIAPQAFKGSISALEAAKAMDKGVRKVFSQIETVLIPVADGGDGTLETLVESSSGTLRTAEITGPLGEITTAHWGAMGDNQTAIIEMARTSGLAMVPPAKRNPLITTTYGLGEMIRHAMEAGFRRFIIGIGGSATNDGGTGMAQALGIHFTDLSGNELPFGGAGLSKLHKIDISQIDPRILQSEFMVACDVSNPLTGPEGASEVYGPQKGATPEMVAQLDQALTHLAQVIRKDLGLEINDISGAGAAGGLGGGLIAFLNGKLRTGVDIVLDTLRLDDKLYGADLVITGEGSLDFQTVYDKAPIGVAKRAKNNGIPVIAVSGSLGNGYTNIHEHGIDAALAIIRYPMTLEESSQNASELITDATEQAFRLLKVGTTLSNDFR